MEYPDKKEKARNFVAEHLKADILDPKTLPLRETTINFAMSIFKLIVVAFNVAYTGVQWVYSILLALGDLIFIKGLQKIMPVPKTDKNKDVWRIIDPSQ